MHTTAAGIETQFQRLGHGPTLVLLHGWGCDWQIWSPVITELSRNFRLIIPDLPAFGQSATPSKPWTTPDYVTWLHEFLSVELDADSFSIIGHSFGGKIAAMFAATQPKLGLRQLVLVDSSGLPTPLSPIKALQKSILGIIPDTLKDVIPLELKHKLLAATGSSTDHFQASEQQRLIFKRIYQEDITTQLTQITESTLIIWGANDVDTPLNQGYRFQELIPESQLLVFDESGHFPFIDQPQQFITSIRNFVNHG